MTTLPRLEPFQDELPISETVRSVAGPVDRRLAITARVTPTRFHAALPMATTWSYRLVEGNVARPGSGETYLGPTIEVQRGEEITITWTNGIADDATIPFDVVKVPNTDATTTRPVPQNEPGQSGALSDEQDMERMQLRGLRAALVTHLHGGRTQSYADGWPDDTIVSGQATRFTYGNDQAATMLWYHDHAMGVTRLNVFAGLAGAWLVRDAEEARLGLPDAAHEIPLIIQDRNLDVDDSGAFTGALVHKTEVDDGPMEFFGPYTLVNGKIWPKATVEARLYRLRVLNGSNARTYRLLLLDAQGRVINELISQIGCDQGLMEHATPLPPDGLLLAPAERVDLLVDLAGRAGEHLYLWNTADAPFADDPGNRTDAPQVARELRAVLDDPRASAGDLDPRNDINRRPFPQVMRFDVSAAAVGTSHVRPAGRLWSEPHASHVIDARTTIRMMALVEEPPNAHADPSATSMLVFWEYVPVDEQAAPAGVTSVTFTYWHPGKHAFESRQFWKAAANFYDQINWRVPLGATELWYIVNASPDTHPIHVHLVDMTVDQRWEFAWNGEGELDPATATLTRVEATKSLAIEPSVRGPKDTVRVNPGEMVGIAMTFAPYPGRYMYHCHILEHEDHDMMRPFIVVPSWVAHHMS